MLFCLDCLFILIGCVVGVCGLFARTHTGVVPQRLNRVGKISASLIIASAALTLTINSIKQHRLAASEQLTRELEAQQLHLQRDLAAAKELSSSLRTDNAALMQEVSRFKQILDEAQQIPIQGLPQPVAATYEVKGWHDNTITLKFDPPLASIAVVAIAITDEFKGTPFSERPRRLRASIVNVRSIDMNLLTVGVAEYSNWQGYVGCCSQFVHNDLITLPKSQYTGNYVIRMDPSNLHVLRSVLKRNPDAGVRLELVD